MRMKYLNYAGLLVVAILAETGDAQSGAELAKRFDLPDAYAGVARFYSQRDSDEAWGHTVFKVSVDALSMVKKMHISGVGENISEVRYGCADESLLILPPDMSVNRTTRFADTLTDAGEINFTPMPIIRVLLARSDEIQVKEKARLPDGLVTIEVKDSQFSGIGIIEIDYREDKIIEYRAIKRGDRFIMVVQFDDWVELPDGGHLPTQVTTALWDTAVKDDYMIYATVVDPRSIGIDDIEPPQIPKGYTVVDHFDGVTRQDGKTLGKIKYSETTPSASTSAGRLNSWLLWGGVGLVVASGVLIGVRRRAM